MVAILLAVAPKQQKWSWVLFEFRVCSCYKVLCGASFVCTDNTLYSLNTPHQSVHVTFCLTVASASREAAATEGICCTPCRSFHAYMVLYILVFVAAHIWQQMCASKSTNGTPCLLGLSHMCVVQSARSYGITSDVYTFLIGLSAASWPLMGYDAVAHMIEETKSADTTAGKAMPCTLLACFGIGTVYLLALTLCIQVGRFLVHCTSYCMEATAHTMSP